MGSGSGGSGALSNVFCHAFTVADCHSLSRQRIARFNSKCAQQSRSFIDTKTRFFHLDPDSDVDLDARMVCEKSSACTVVKSMGAEHAADVAHANVHQSSSSSDLASQTACDSQFLVLDM